MKNQKNFPWWAVGSVEANPNTPIFLLGKTRVLCYIFIIMEIPQELDRGSYLTLLAALTSVDDLLPLPESHPVYSCLAKSLRSEDGNLIAYAVDVLCRLAKSPENRSPCMDALMEGGAQLERYIQVHSDLFNSSDVALNRNLVIGIMRMSNFRLRGSDLLAYLNNSVYTALVGICSALNIHSSKPDSKEDCEQFVSCCHLLYEIVSPPLYFAQVQKTDVPMATVQKAYHDHLWTIVRCTLRLPVLQTLSQTFERWLACLEDASGNAGTAACCSSFFLALTHVMAMLTSLMSCNSSNLKSSIVDSRLVMCVVLPLLSHVTGSRLTHPQHVTCVFSCLRLLAVLSRHNAKGLPLLLAQYPRIGETLVAAVADLPSPQKLEGLSIITQFVVNNELADAAADLAQKIQPLPESDKAFIAHKLKDPVDGACLLNVHSSCYDLPCEALCAQKFWLSEEKGAVPAELFQHESTTKQKSGDVVRALLQKRAERAYYYQRRKRQQTKKRKAARSSEDEWEDLSDDDEETAVAGTSAADALPCPAPLQTPALAPESHTPPQKVEESKCAPPSSIPSPPDLSRWRKAPPAGVPAAYLCALSQQLISIPVLSPFGDVFDKQTILAYLQAKNNRCPITGDELYPSDLVVDNQLWREIDRLKSTGYLRGE